MVAYHDPPDLPVAAQEGVLREAGAAIVRWAGANPRQPHGPIDRNPA